MSKVWSRRPVTEVGKSFFCVSALKETANLSIGVRVTRAFQVFRSRWAVSVKVAPSQMGASRCVPGSRWKLLKPPWRLSHCQPQSTLTAKVLSLRSSYGPTSYLRLSTL